MYHLTQSATEYFVCFWLEPSILGSPQLYEFHYFGLRKTENVGERDLIYK